VKRWLATVVAGLLMSTIVGSSGVASAATYGYGAPAQIVSAMEIVGPVEPTTTIPPANPWADATRGERATTSRSRPWTSDFAPRRAAKAGSEGVDAAWGVSKYKHGGVMSTIEHINYRHAYESGSPT
jgi:hypothetical protein